MPRRRSFLSLAPIAVASAALGSEARAAAPSAAVPGPATTADRIAALIADLDDYALRGMKIFGVPGLAIGIVADDKLVYAKGFGVRSKSGGQPVDARTVFQIGSLTKAFLATSLAVMADRRKLAWDDRVIDLHPAFQLHDPWVTREFRVFDLLAQRSGLPPLVNDTLAMIGFDEAALIASLRHVPPVTSFRTSFAYTNITHLLASRIAADAAGVPEWTAFLQTAFLGPLGMKASTYTAEALAAEPNHAAGHRWAPDGTTEVPMTPIFPYHLAGAGNLNSNIEDMARWLRLQLGQGVFEGQRIVSAENLAVTRMTKVAMSDTRAYAMGWHILQTPNGSAVWHDGDVLTYGSFLGMVPSLDAGIIILTNESNVGFPDALGAWILDRILGNPPIDYVGLKLPEAVGNAEAHARQFAKPANPRPFTPVASLAGKFVSPSMGAAVLASDDGDLVLDIAATGARFRLTPWDGQVFTIQLEPSGRFAPIAELDYMTKGFAAFQADGDGRLDTLRLVFSGQAFELRRL